jgi:hypothetical protein
VQDFCRGERENVKRMKYCLQLLNITLVRLPSFLFLLLFFYSFFTLIPFVYIYGSDSARKIKNIIPLLPMEQPIGQLQQKSFQNWAHPHNSFMPVPSLIADNPTILLSQK